MQTRIRGTNATEGMTAERVKRGGVSPFLKWAGGKTQLLPQLERAFPSWPGTYFEPFLGSGAVFFGLGVGGGKNPARLSDANSHLINAFRAVRDQPAPLVEALRHHASLHSREHYYQVRARGLGHGSEIERAAVFIYLNRTCFNGLFRLNRAGAFNVPMGRYINPRICDAPGLIAASAALQGADIRACSYLEAMEAANAGDFVYLDPPYEPLSETSSFTAYTANAFGREQQVELANTIRELSAKGVLVALSNSDTPFIRALYAKEYRLIEVMARRRINSKAEKRGIVGELVVVNF